MEVNCKAFRDLTISKVKKELEGEKVILTIIQVGDDPRSNSYIQSKIAACNEANILTQLYKLDYETTEDELIKLIDTLNNNEDVRAILVQSPLPSHINEERVMQRISPAKDVDCFTYENVCKMLNNESNLLPCTPKGIVEILENQFYGDLEYTNILIIGKGKTVGRYLVPILNNKGATCLQIHSKSKDDIKEYIDKFKPDVIISCVGKDGTINKQTLNDHNPRLIIDCGISFKGKQLRGDFLREDYPYLDLKRINYTPCKGGVGLTTVASVLTNIVELVKQAKK